MDVNGIPLKAIIIEGTGSDCKQACNLIDKMKAEYLVADRGYDVDRIIDDATALGMKPATSPKKSKGTKKLQP